MRELPKRKRVRLIEYDYSSAGCYFITICVKDKHEILGQIVGDAVLSVPIVELSEIGIIINDYLIQLSAQVKYAILEKYVIMPNHVHLMVLINDGTQRTASPTKAVIPRIVHGLKTIVTKNIGYSIWQRSYHDHIIRNEAEYQKIWQYIDENPIRWHEDCYYQ